MNLIHTKPNNVNRSSSRDELVSLSEIGEDGCASEVQVSAMSRSPTRQTAIILAQGLGNVILVMILMKFLHILSVCLCLWYRE